MAEKIRPMRNSSSVKPPAVPSPEIPSNGGKPAVTVASSIVESLQEQLISIRRDAISVLRVTEDLLRLPPEKRALRTRAERRSSPGDGAGSVGAGSVGAGSGGRTAGGYDDGDMRSTGR